MSPRKLIGTVALAALIGCAALIWTESGERPLDDSSGRMYSLSVVDSVDEDGTTPIQELEARFESTIEEHGYTTVTYLMYLPQHCHPKIPFHARWGNWNGSGDHASECALPVATPTGTTYVVVFRTFDASDTLVETRALSHTVS